MDSSHSVLSPGNHQVTDFQGLVSPIQVQPQATRTLAQAKRKPAVVEKAAKSHSPQRKRVMIRKTMTLPSVPYELGSLPQENLPPNSPRRKTRKEAILSPTLEMRRLPSSRSAKKSPVGPGKNDFKPENRYIATSPKHSAILQVKHLKATVITSRVAAELKTIRAIEKSDGKVVKLNPVLSQEKPEAAVKPVAKTVPLEKLQNLQALLNNKDIPVHVSKKARKVVVAPPISSAPIISKGIDPERAAKGKQYIKERKALELKKKKALAEKERQERERVASALKKIEDIRKEQREHVRKAKLLQKLVPVIVDKPSVEAIQPVENFKPLPNFFADVDVSKNDNFVSQVEKDLSTILIEAEIDNKLVEPTEIKTIVGPSVVEQVIPTAAPISTIPMVSLEKNETKKNLGLIVEDANGVSVYPSIVQPVNASLEVTDHKSLITGLSLPPVPMTDSASKPTPPNLDSVAANIVSPSEPLIPKNTETDKDISEIERHAIEDRLLNLHRSFALVTQRLGVYEEALASKVSNSKDVSSFNENNVPSLLPDVLIIKNQEADSTSFASVTALKDEGIKENQKIPPKNLDIIGVGNLAEFSKKRNNLERLHNAAFKIQVFYKKQKLRRSMVGKSRAKSPNRSPTYAHGRDLLFHDLLQKVHPREREKEIDGSLRPLKSSQGFEFKTSPSLGNRNPSDSNHTESVISPVINITNYLGLSAISKTLLPQSESKIAGEEKIPPKLVNSKPKLEESVPFVIPKNFKHSILNLYTKYIAKSGASELLGLKSTDQSVPQIQKPQSSLNLEEFIQPTLPPESLIFNNEEPAVSNRVPEISPSHLNVMRSETPDAAGIEKKVDSEVSDVSELSEALYSSFNQIKSPSNYISKSHSAEELRSTSFYDYENESFESLPSNNAPASPPLKQIREVPKTFTPGDVFARQKRDLMGMDGLARLAPLALGRKFDLELQNFAAVDLAVQQVTEMHRNRSVAISHQENAALAQLYLQQDKNHAEELERARQRRSVSNSVPDFHSKKSQNDKNYDDSFDSISDIPQPRVINRSSPSKLAQQTDSESIEELIEAAVNPRTTNSVSEKIASDSIDELIQGATSYVHKVKEPKKEQLKQQFYSEGTAKAKNYSAAEFQLKLKLNEIQNSDYSSEIQSLLSKSVRLNSPNSDDSSISEYLPKDSISYADISEDIRSTKEKVDNIYDNDSFYSADLDLSSIEAKWTSENAKTLDLQRIHNSHPAESLKEEDELFKGLDSIKNSEDREKQQKNSLVAQLDEDRPTLKDSCKPPSNKNSQKKSTRQIDFDTLSASIQEIGDDLSSFQEELLKAGRSPSRSTYHSVSPEKISPEKAALLDRSHPIAIATAENNEKIKILQQDVLYWESKRKLDELNERLRLAKKEGDSAPVLVHATEDAASVIQETAMPAQITPTPNLETNSIANTAGSQTASIARTTDHILEITPNKPVTKSEAVIAIDSVINQPTMSLSPEHGSIVGETPSTDFKILPQEINATNYLIVNQEVQEIGESMELLKKLADPAEDTEDLISEDLRGFAVAAKQPLNLPIPDIKSSTEISKITANALGSGNNELKDIDHEIIYEPDFEDIDSSTASASNILEISDLNKSGEESVKVGTAEKFVFNVIDNLDPQSSAALTTATEFSKSFTTSSNDIDLSIKMIPTNLVEALTESIFSDLLKDSLDLAVTMTQPLLLKSESLPLASNPAVAKLPVSSLVSNNSVITSPFSSFIPPVIELDYNTILANGCAYVIQLLSEILPEGSTYWEPPLIKAINELPALLEPVRDLLIDVANEAIFDQFEKHRFYDDPRTKLYQRRTIKPAKVSKEALINGCSTKFRMWRMHSIKHGTNLDALLIETVKSEGKILCNILNDEILVKKRIFEEIWNDLIEDTAHCALDANLI